MKRLINQLLYGMENDLTDVPKSQMTLMQRCKYEKAMANIQILIKIVDNCDIKTKDQNF